MILDLPRFMAAERPYWGELESVLAKLETETEAHMELPAIERLHYLYERCSADLARLDRERDAIHGGAADNVDGRNARPAVGRAHAL